MRFLTLILILISLCACTSAPIPVYPAINFKQKLIIKRPKVALVLGGGGARGFAHLGVLKALQDAHIPIDLIVGTSAGSLVGGLYAANPVVDELTHTMMNSSYLDYIDISLQTPLSGLIKGTQLQQFIQKNTRITDIRKTQIPFIAVTTELNTGWTVPLSEGSLAQAITASCAVPSVVQPLLFANAILVDGGISDPLPVDIAKRYHPDIIIAVNINAEPASNIRLTLPSVAAQSIDIMLLHLTEFSIAQADIHIHPDVGCSSMFNLANKEKFYQAGLAAGRAAIPRIKRKLNS